jgi:DNA polymerase V
MHGHCAPPCFNGPAFQCRSASRRRRHSPKLANYIAKKDQKHGGVALLVDEAAQDAAPAHIDLTDLWGIAHRLAGHPQAIGIKTPLDLKRGDPWLIRERLGVVTMRLALELRGVPRLDLELQIADRKSIMASRSFGRPVTTLTEMREAVASYTARSRKTAPSASGDRTPDGVHRDQ